MSDLNEALAAKRHKFHPSEVVVPGEDYYALTTAGRRWSEFPSGKDVEVAINAFRSTERSDNDGWDGLLNPIRAALEAVRARETGETPQ